MIVDAASVSREKLAALEYQALRNAGLLDNVSNKENNPQDAYKILSLDPVATAQRFYDTRLFITTADANELRRVSNNLFEAGGNKIKNLEAASLGLSSLVNYADGFWTKWEEARAKVEEDPVHNWYLLQEARLTTSSWTDALDGKQIRPGDIWNNFLVNTVAGTGDSIERVGKNTKQVVDNLGDTAKDLTKIVQKTVENLGEAGDYLPLILGGVAALAVISVGSYAYHEIKT